MESRKSKAAANEFLSHSPGEGVLDDDAKHHPVRVFVREERDDLLGDRVIETHPVWFALVGHRTKTITEKLGVLIMVSQTCWYPARPVPRRRSDGSIHPSVGCGWRRSTTRAGS